MDRWLSIAAVVADLAVVLMVTIFGVNWDVFKSLCGMGHTFDAHYQVEIGTPDEIAEDFCAYSTLEQMVLAASCVQALLGILMLLALLQMLPELPLQAEARREAIKKLSSRFGALGEVARACGAIDTRSGPLKAEAADLEDGHGVDDLGVALCVGSARRAPRSSRRSDTAGLGSARSQASEDSGRRRRKAHEAPSGSARGSGRKARAEEEDLELGELFAPVKGPLSGRSPRRAVSPRRVGRPEGTWETSPAVLQSEGSVNSWMTEGPSAELFKSMRSSAAGLSMRGEDEVEVAKQRIEEEDEDFGTDFFA